MGPDRGRRLSAAAFAVGAAYEASLSDAARRSGSHYTRPDVACGLVRLTLELWSESCDPDRGPRCLDPSCGGGVFLVALADALLAAGFTPTDVVDHHIVGVDTDPGAVAASTEALRRWALDHGARKVDPQVSLGDGLDRPPAVAGSEFRLPVAGFDVIVGNPPFQNQLGSATARSDDARRAAHARFGSAATGYVDTAALFLLAARERLEAGGVMCLIQPRTTMSSSHAAGVRRSLAASSTLVARWEPGERVFDAAVDVWAPVFRATDPTVGSGHDVRLLTGPRADRAAGSVPDVGDDWARLSSGTLALPDISGWSADGTLADLAWATAGFRDEFYALLAHTTDEPVGGTTMRLVTTGSIDPGVCRWGDRPIRFGKRTWQHPWLDVDGLRQQNPRVAAWVDRLAVPKVLVATQTRVVECVVDPVGDLVPVTPTIAVIPGAPEDLHRVAAVLSAPPVSVWARRRRAGSGLSATAMRLSARDLLEVPLPAAAVPDLPDCRSDDATLRSWGRRAAEAYGLVGDSVVDWWLENRPVTRHDGGRSRQRNAIDTDRPVVLP